MNPPRLKVEMGLPEVSAFARLRAALFADLGVRLPAAMESRTRDLVSKGKVKELYLAEVAKGKHEGLPDEDAQVFAVGVLLLGEAREVGALLVSECARETTTAQKAEAVIAAMSTPADAPG